MNGNTIQSIRQNNNAACTHGDYNNNKEMWKNSGAVAGDEFCFGSD